MTRIVVVQILVGVRIDQVSELDKVQSSRNTSRSELIREAIDEWLLRHSPPHSGGGKTHGPSLDED